MNDRLRQLLDDAIASDLCSAAAVAVGDRGREVHLDAVGLTRNVPDPGEPIDADTLFDLASLTKPMATAAIAMALCSRGWLSPNTPVCEVVPTVTDPRINLAVLLGHNAGFPAHRKLYERLWAGDLAGQTDPRAALVEMAASTPLEREPYAEAVYSDLGYIVAGAALEADMNRPLEELFAEVVAGPLGLTGARFVDLRQPDRPARAVATELCQVRGLMQGEVHDENCHAAGGVAGHAGLFASVRDVSTFAGAIVAGIAGRDAGELKPDVVQMFLERRGPSLNTWRLGWDTASSEPGVSSAGDRWPRRAAFGHTGFTGTSIWLDGVNERWVVLLTNRVHPSRGRDSAERIKRLRRAVADTVVDALG